MPLQMYTTLKSHEKDKSKYQSLHVMQTLSSHCIPASHEQVGIQVQEEATSTTRHSMVPQGASLCAESSAKQGRKRKEEREAEGRDGGTTSHPFKWLLYKKTQKITSVGMWRNRTPCVLLAGT